jgi:hypothetical protein
MPLFYIKVGDHDLKIKLQNIEYLSYFTERFHYSYTPLEAARMTITVQGGYGVPFVTYDVFTTRKEGEILYRRQDYLIEVDSDFTNATLFVHDKLALKHALMNLYSAFILHHNWGLLLHSSCVIEGTKAHVFAGHSGAGKSTAAKLSAPRELLSDEATLLKVNNDGVTIYHSPFRSELETRSDKKVVPLSSIQLLSQASFNERNLLKQSDAFLQLMDKVFYWPYGEHEVANVLRLLKSVVLTIPVYELHFQKNNTFWELIS